MTRQDDANTGLRTYAAAAAYVRDKARDVGTTNDVAKPLAATEEKQEPAEDAPDTKRASGNIDPQQMILAAGSARAAALSALAGLDDEARAAALEAANKAYDAAMDAIVQRERMAEKARRAQKGIRSRG